TAITDMLGKKEQKLAVSWTIIFSVAFEFIFFILFYTDLDLLGVVDPLRPFSIDYGVFLTISILIIVLVFLGTGLKFTQESVKSENQEIRLKGKLLRVAFIIFAIATILEKVARSIMLGFVFDDPSDPLLTVMLVIVRILLILSAFSFYSGFLLPPWINSMLTRLSKKKTQENK
ncbi:unnamed protein product, partial [marine sediment metagenome]